MRFSTVSAVDRECDWCFGLIEAGEEFVMEGHEPVCLQCADEDGWL